MRASTGSIWSLRALCRAMRGPLALIAIAVIHDALAATDSSESPPASGPQQGSPQGLAEVLVTAERRSENILDVPYNISAVSGEELAASNVVDLSKLTRAIPGLQMTDRGIRDNTATARLVSRGLNLDSAVYSDVPFVTTPTVATYIDDTPVFLNLRLIDIQRVEFLRGPQGTLYGSGSLGGTVRFVQNTPDPAALTARIEAAGAQTEGAGGPDGSVNGLVNIPLGGTAAVRIMGGEDYYHGFIRATHLASLDSQGIALPANPADPLGSPPLTHSENDVNNSRVIFTRAVFAANPLDSVSLQLSYHYQHENGGGRDAQSLDSPYAGDHEIATYLKEPGSRVANVGSATLEGRLGWATLTSATSYFYTTSDATTDATGPYEVLGLLLIPRITAPVYFTTANHTFVEELRLVSSTSGPTDWIVGGYYSRQSTVDIDEQDYLRGESLIGNPQTAPNDLFLHLHRDSLFKDAALFGELTYHLSSKWALTGGVRLIHQDFDSFSYFLFPKFPTTPAEPVNATSARPLYKLNASYHVAGTLTVFGTFSEGFRRGGANSLPTSGPLAEPGSLVSYAPDEVKNYEIGVKGMLGERFRYSAGAYFINWYDAQVSVLTPVNGYDAAVNAGNARSEGLEFELSGSLSPDCTVSLGYAYTDAYLLTALQNYANGQPGARLPGVSRHTGFAALDYRQPINPGTTLTWHVDGSYRSNFNNNVDVTAPMYRVFGGFGLLAASLTLSHGPFDLSLYGENLTNREAPAAQNDPTQAGPNYFMEWIGRPRQIGLRVSYQYGRR